MKNLESNKLLRAQLKNHIIGDMATKTRFCTIDNKLTCELCGVPRAPYDFALRVLPPLSTKTFAQVLCNSPFTIDDEVDLGFCLLRRGKIKYHLFYVCDECYQETEHINKTEFITTIDRNDKN